MYYSKAVAWAAANVIVNGYSGGTFQPDQAIIRRQAAALFNELGMNLSTAFNVFVRQSLREGRIPFEISLNQPNKETIAAMLEAERIAKDPSVKGYNDLDELLAADLKA